METYAARLASFNTVHSATKKRASDPHGKRTLKWPHKRPTPPQLAQAGFFYQPTSSCPDNVTCYLCRAALDGWEETDDPIVEHISHSGHCGWALTVAAERAIENGSEDIKDPLSEAMIEIRRMTFACGWPHETKRGWLCKTQKMIEAGWYYCPTLESDDFVRCSYCALSLDGWEPKDDPFEEHRRRSPECRVFSFSSMTGKPKSKKGKKGRPSKTSRTSTQSNATTASEALIRNDVDVDLDDSVLSTTAISKTGKGRGRTKGRKQSRSSTRSNMTTASEAPLRSDADMNVNDSIMSTARTSDPSKNRRNTRGAKAKEETFLTDDAETAVDDSVPHVATAPTQGRSRRGTRGTRTSRMSIQSILTVGSEVPSLSDIDIDLDESLSSAATAPKKGRGRRGTRLTKAKKPAAKSKVAQSVLDEHAMTVSYIEPEDDDFSVKVDQSPEPITNSKKRKSQELEQEDKAIDQAEIVDIPEPAEEMEDQTAKAKKPPKRAKTASKTGKNKKAIAKAKAPPKEPSPELAKVPSPAPSSLEARTSPMSPQIQRTPVASPQSSDAENQPPSSRPSQVRPPLAVRSPSLSQAARIPLAITTPKQSPSKKTLSELQSTMHWTAIDLERIFQGTSGADKENGPLFFGSAAEKPALTSPERELTVEQWIQFNAQRGEEKLRDECERMVGNFEGEGMRALRSLEGIVCAE